MLLEIIFDRYCASRCFSHLHAYCNVRITNRIMCAQIVCVFQNTF